MHDNASELNNSFEAFKEALIKINFQQNLTKLTFDQLELFEKELENHGVTQKRNSEDFSKINGCIGTNYNDLVSNKIVEISFEEYSYSDLLKTRSEIKNQQYQLLLLHAFEAFEKYLKTINQQYQISNLRDGATKISASILSNKFWLKSVINSKINHNRLKNDALLDTDYLILDFAIIEQLRHNIAHALGFANDKNKFVKECLNRIGSYQNGSPKKVYLDTINYYFGTRKYQNLICLTEVYGMNINSFYTSYHDRLRHLIERMSSFIFYIHDNHSRLFGIIDNTED